MSKTPIFRKALRFVRWWWLGSGVIAFCVGICFAIYSGTFIMRSLVTTGTIIGLDEVPDQQTNSINYAPVFSFTAQNGSTYSVRSGTASNPPGFTIGEHVRVLYLKNNPSAAKLDSFVQLWLVTVICCGIGFGLSGGSLLPLIIERRIYKPEAATIPNAMTANQTSSSSHS